MRILLVEDDEIKRNQIINYLYQSEESIQIETAKSVQSGLKHIVSGEFDLIILDMTLPTFDISADEDGGRPRAYGGRELLAQMKRRIIETPVLVVTQFDRFGKEPELLTLEELDKQLKGSFENYIGSVYYSSAFDNWKTILTESITVLKRMKSQ
jgi:CheY-like chemotaxis protein